MCRERIAGAVGETGPLRSGSSECGGARRALAKLAGLSNGLLPAPGRPALRAEIAGRQPLSGTRFRVFRCSNRTPDALLQSAHHLAQAEEETPSFSAARVKLSTSATATNARS